MPALTFETKKTWAMIEEAIALQMAHNIEVNCKFTPKVADAFATKFGTGHKFFSISHHKGDLKVTSSLYEDFRSCNRDKLDQEYQELFQQLKPF